MNIQEIVDKIIKETDIPANEYTVADRVIDINIEANSLWELARQIGGKYPVYSGNPETETFTTVTGDQNFDRTILDVSIVKIEWREDSDNDWECVKRDKSVCECKLASCNCPRWTANSSQIKLEDAWAGEIQVTYDGSKITEFTEADYSLTTPPTPEWLPRVFHSLLWLNPAMTQTYYYNKEKYQILEAKYLKLEEKFKNYYYRDFDNDLGKIKVEGQCKNNL